MIVKLLLCYAMGIVRQLWDVCLSFLFFLLLLAVVGTTTTTTTMKATSVQCRRNKYGKCGAGSQTAPNIFAFTKDKPRCFEKRFRDLSQTTTITESIHWHLHFFLLFLFLLLLALYDIIFFFTLFILVLIFVWKEKWKKTKIPWKSSIYFDRHLWCWLLFVPISSLAFFFQLCEWLSVCLSMQ